MFSKVKRPLEIERDSSPKRAKSRKGLLTCGIGTGNRNVSICNKQTQIRIRLRIYENLRVIYCKKSTNSKTHFDGFYSFGFFWFFGFFVVSGEINILFYTINDHSFRICLRSRPAVMFSRLFLNKESKTRVTTVVSYTSLHDQKFTLSRK